MQLGSLLMRRYSAFALAQQSESAWPVVVILVLLSLVAESAQAQEFRISQDCAMVGCMPGDLPGLPVQITQPGHYRLVGDLLLEANDGFALYVGAPGGAVTIDLGGYTIRGAHACVGGTPPMGGGAPVTECSFTETNGGAIRVDAVSELTIRNGTIRGIRSQGISVSAGNLVLIEDMLITENGSGITVSRSTPSANALLRIRRVSLNRNLSYGLRTIGDDAGIVILENSQVFGNGYRGVSLDAAGASVVREVQISRAGQHGLVGAASNKRCYSTSYFANNGGAVQVFGCPGLYNRCLQGSC
jgi:hypothetical protein